MILDSWMQKNFLVLIPIYRIAILRFCDCFSDWTFTTFSSLQTLNTNFDLKLTGTIYFKLRAALLFFLSDNKPNISSKGKALPEFFTSFKMGSKICRKILMGTSNNFNTCDTTTTISFFNICGVLVPDSETLESVLPLWTLNAIPNQRREFIFKFFNNKLRINTRTFHFGGSTRFCTFCSTVGNPNTGKTFEHLFLTCPITNVVHEQLDEAVFRSRHVSLLNKKLNWLGCQKSDNNIIF